MREATIEERGIVIKLEYIQLITEVAKLAQFTYYYSYYFN